MTDELFDPLQVVGCELLNIVVTSSINIVRGELMLCGGVQLTCMIERHNFISPAVYDENWTVYVRHPIDIWELVKRKSPSEIEDNSEGGHESRVKDDSGYIVLLCKVGRRARSDGASIEDDVVWADIQVLSQVKIDCFNIIVERRLCWYSTIAFSKTCILIHYRVDFDVFQEVRLQPSLHQVDVLSIAVREDDRVLCIAIDEEHLELATTLRV